MSGSTGVETAVVSFNRATRDAAEVNLLLESASAECHLVSPATNCGTIPEGFSVALSTVMVNIERETYPARGAGNDEDDKPARRESYADDLRSLSKVALDRIASAAAVSWDPRESHLLSKAMHYVHYKAVGSYRHFDGTIITIQDEKEIDLRDGSAYVRQLEEQAARRGKTADLRISQERVHILSSAITKARLRALRSLGIRISYTRSELLMPFVVVRLMATGATEDPILRRQFAVMRMQAAMSSRTALYGSPSTDAVVEAPQMHEPPPVESTPPESELGDPEPMARMCEYCGSEHQVAVLRGPGGDAACCSDPKCQDLARKNISRAPSSGAASNQDGRPKPTPAASPRPSPQGGAAGARSPGTPRGSVAPLSGFLIPGGDEKGVPIEKATDGALRYWERRIETNMRGGHTDARYVDKDRRLLEAIDAEFARRDRDDNVPY